MQVLVFEYHGTNIYYVSPDWGRHIVFGSVVVCVVICVIPCEHDNF